MKQRMISTLLLVSVIVGMDLIAYAQLAKPKIFNIKSYGAIGDGVAIETEAVQKTIDAYHAVGGGIVWVPAGDLNMVFPAIQGATRMANWYSTEFRKVTQETGEPWVIHFSERHKPKPVRNMDAERFKCIPW